MKKTIHFYLKQIAPFLTIAFGIYVILNISTIFLEVFLQKENIRGIILTRIVMFIFLTVYLIRFNQLDTGKENFTIVSMTGQSHTSIMISKLIVSYIVIILFIILQAIFTTLAFFLLSNIFRDYGLSYFLFGSFGLLRILALFTLLLSYISNPMIWVRAFADSKIFRRLSFVAVIITWYVSNKMMQLTLLNISGGYPGIGRSFGRYHISPIAMIWNLVWCIVFFSITLYLQKRKIDSI